MQKNTRKNQIAGYIGAVLITLILIGCLVLAICQYNVDSRGYDELTRREYTFVEYRLSKGTVSFYVEEEDSLVVTCANLFRKGGDYDVIKNARKGDKMVVYESRNALGLRSHVHEGQINGNYFLRLEDTQQYNEKNSLIGFIVCPVLLLVWLAVAGYFFAASKNKKDNGKTNSYMRK